MTDFGDLPRLSPNSGRLKKIRSLTSRSRLRAEAGQLVVEGTTSVMEAIQHGVPVEQLVFADTPRGHDAFEALHAFDGDRMVASAETLARSADTAGAPPVLAVARIPSRVLPVKARLVVVADAIADPGNAGTLMRIAEASGADALVLGSGSVDPWSPKVVRSSAGAWARLSIVESPLPPFLRTAKAAGSTIVGLDAGAGPDYRTVDPPVPAVVVVGNESHGISADVRAEIDEYVSIPMADTVESLNAAVAVAVVLFAWKPR